jgi:hypothetical protein
VLPLPLPVAAPDVEPLGVDALPAPVAPVLSGPLLVPVVLPDPDICIRHPVAVTFPPLLPVCPVLPALPEPLCAEPSAAVMQMPMIAAPLQMNFRFMLSSCPC